MCASRSSKKPLNHSPKCLAPNLKNADKQCRKNAIIELDGCCSAKHQKVVQKFAPEEAKIYCELMLDYKVGNASISSINTARKAILLKIREEQQRRDASNKTVGKLLTSAANSIKRRQEEENSEEVREFQAKRQRVLGSLLADETPAPADNLVAPSNGNSFVAERVFAFEALREALSVEA